MTGTPRATASLIAPVTFAASEQEMRTAFAPSLTACAIRCACTWPSSVGGVSQTISTGTLYFRVSSRAAASAPVRAERNTGFVELFAIMAIFSPAARWVDCGAWARHPLNTARIARKLAYRRSIFRTLHPGRFSPWASRARATTVRASKDARYERCALRARPAARGQPRTRLVEHHRDDNGAPDDDPLVILIEVQSTNRLTDEHDQQ